MRQEAKVTSKGQITIPREIRRALDLEPGDIVVFETDDDGVRMLPREAESPFAKYRGIWREGAGLTHEEFLAELRAIRGYDEYDEWVAAHDDGL